MAHILLPVATPEDADTMEAVIERAETLRQQIDSGDVTFAEAARQHSSSPTASQGGELGSIGRHHPMPEPFSKAAFDLQKGEISSPVVTPFGVHLILCQEILPGKKTWQDARGELRRAVTEYLFRWIADRQRPQAKIEINEQYARQVDAASR